MRILITGNLGYVGSILGTKLRSGDKNYLVGVDSGFFGSCLTGNPIMSPDRSYQVQYIQDVRNIEQIDGIESILSKTDAVIHLAALSNDPIGDQFSQVTDDINHKASLSTARLAKKMGVKKFIFASSCSVYGDAGDGLCDESSNLNPLTAYAKSKADTEIGLKKISDKSFKSYALRFATACGRSPRTRLDLVLNDFTANASLYGNIKLLSSGQQYRPLIHVEDMCNAIEWALKDSRSTEDLTSVNVGSNDWNFKIRELATGVADALNVDVSIASSAPTDNRSYSVSFKKFQSLAPEFKFARTLKESVIDLAEEIEKTHSLKEYSFRESKFVRLNNLRYLIDQNMVDSQLFWRS